MQYNNSTNFIELKKTLDFYYKKYNNKQFIDADPIQVPHNFTKKQDIEIAGFFAAIIAWGNRKTIVRNALQLMQRMDNAPYDFIQHHTENDLKKLQGFVHRTFNDTDLLYFIWFFNHHYKTNDSLETCFSKGLQAHDSNIENALTHFYTYATQTPNFLPRTTKHIATPSKNSACKRLCMYLRWMVRHDKNGVDFGIWKQIQPSQLICPLDVHVERNALKLGILNPTLKGWKAAVQLTETLAVINPNDPVKYDFALFGMGLEKENFD